MLFKEAIQSKPAQPGTLPAFGDEIQAGQLALLSYLHWPGTGMGDVLRIGLTSCVCGEGVTTVASRLALAAATVGHGKVLLVDANLRRPALHRHLPISPAPGLSEFLLGEKSPGRAIQTGPIADLAVLPAGGRGRESHHLLVGDRVNRLLLEIQDDYSLIVFDMPALAGDSTTLAWAASLDAIVLVIEAERVRWEVARRAKEQLKRAGANLQGAVLNKRRLYIPNWLARCDARASR
ncbi:MAG: tyrosine-protein kinase family protein [Thermoguttaceae bacterium]